MKKTAFATALVVAGAVIPLAAAPPAGATPAYTKNGIEVGGADDSCYVGDPWCGGYVWLTSKPARNADKVSIKVYNARGKRTHLKQYELVDYEEGSKSGPLWWLPTNIEAGTYTLAWKARTYGEAAHWNCSIYYYDHCRWIKAKPGKVKSGKTKLKLRAFAPRDGWVS